MNTPNEALPLSQYPSAYRFAQPHQQPFQSLIEWPATTVNQAIYNGWVAEQAAMLLPTIDKLVTADDRYMNQTVLAAFNEHLKLSREERVAHVSKNILGYLDPVHPKHPIHWIYSVMSPDANDERWYGPLDVLREISSGLPIITWRQEREITDMKRQVNDLIGKLRTMSDEPFELSISEQVQVFLSPINGGGDAVTVSRSGWGQTNVNYTHEGLILDVYAEDAPESLHTTSIYAEDLETLQADEMSDGGAS